MAKRIVLMSILMMLWTQAALTALEEASAPSVLTVEPMPESREQTVVPDDQKGEVGQTAPPGDPEVLTLVAVPESGEETPVTGDVDTEVVQADPPTELTPVYTLEAASESRGGTAVTSGEGSRVLPTKTVSDPDVLTLEPTADPGAETPVTSDQGSEVSQTGRSSSHSVHASAWTPGSGSNGQPSVTGDAHSGVGQSGDSSVHGLRAPEWAPGANAQAPVTTDDAEGAIGRAGEAISLAVGIPGANRDRLLGQVGGQLGQQNRPAFSEGTEGDAQSSVGLALAAMRTEYASEIVAGNRPAFAASLGLSNAATHASPTAAERLQQVPIQWAGLNFNNTEDPAP